MHDSRSGALRACDIAIVEPHIAVTAAALLREPFETRAMQLRDGDAAVHALRVGQCDEGSPPQALAGPRLSQVLEQGVHGARRRNGVVDQGLLRAVDHAAGKF